MDDVLERADEWVNACDTVDPSVLEMPGVAFVRDLIAALAAEVRELRDLADRRAVVLAFFRSVTLCGEPWTEKCQQEYDAALSSRGEGG